jgi:diacylglycerol kinase family enzyme
MPALSNVAGHMPLPEGAGEPPVPVIVNRNGGTAAALGDKLRESLLAAFAAAGLRVDLRLVDGRDVAEEVRRCAGAPVVVVGGGDGTLGSAAHARVESGGGALGLLPLGTRNHLARELGIPDKLEEAAALIAAGPTRAIDLATVNDQGFVNNASIGFYPLMVRWRDAERERRGLPKWLATIPAAWATLRRLPHHRLRLSAEGRARPVATPLLFVGNNHYELERGRIGQRLALDDGLLSVFAVSAHSRAGMVWFALRTFAGLSDPARDFAALGDVPALTVHSRADHVHVALDGEVHRMVPPLRFAVSPGALTVIAPQQQAGQDGTPA